MTGPHPIHIRLAALADVPTLVEYNRRLAWETEQLELDPPTLTAGVTAVCRGEGEAIYFVAVDGVDAHIVGQLMLTREWSDWRNGWLYWIQSVYVEAESRGNGVFRQLFERARQHVLDDPQGIGLRLYVEQHNHAARQTYLRLGLVESGHLVMQQILRGPIDR